MLPKDVDFEYLQNLRAKLAPFTSEDEVPVQRDIGANLCDFVAEEVIKLFFSFTPSMRALNCSEVLVVFLSFLSL